MVVVLSLMLHVHCMCIFVVGGSEMTTKAESTPLSSSTCTSNPLQCLISDVTRLRSVLLTIQVYRV